MSKHYDNLLSQLNRLYRHTRLGSYKTRARYYEATQRFCRFVADTTFSAWPTSAPSTSMPM